MSGRFEQFIEAETLERTDVVLATRIAAMVDAPVDSDAALALALTLKATRDGSTALDPTAIAGCPQPEQLTGSPLVTQGVLRVDAGLLYLDRYWADERLVAQRILARSDAVVPTLDPAIVERVIGERHLDPEQQDAVRSVASSGVTILTGGPGMGKTHTIASVLRAVLDGSSGTLRIGLAAPTGKAAGRMNESLQDLLGEASAISPAATLHRLLGRIPRNGQRFRHNARDPLPHDLIVVDEASMVSLSLMARLLESLSPTSRLLLVGDPDQLASVEAGSVLADLVSGLADSGCVIRLVQDHRMGDARGRLATAFRGGSADDVLAAIDGADGSVEFIETDEPTLDLVPQVVEHAWSLRLAAMSDEPHSALSLLSKLRVLCAHRTGPFGVARWNRLVERELAQRAPDILTRPMYAGRPLLITRNDYGLGLANGDTGVVVSTGQGARALIATGSGLEELPTWRLSDVETMHAMTVHKAQGSQAEEVIVIVPPVGSRLLSREMLYTAVTRPTTKLVIVGSRAAIREAVESPARRSSGLAARLRS